jgi:hypothetical protein
MCRVGLVPVGAAIRVMVANGNRIPYDGVACNVAMCIG